MPILAVTLSPLGHVLMMWGRVAPVPIDPLHPEKRMVAKVLSTKRIYGNIDEFLDAELFNYYFTLLARIEEHC